MNSMYDLFMEEYIEEFEEIYKFTEDREGVYKTNYYLRDHLQIPYVSKTLEKRRVKDELIEFVGSILDANSNKLSTSGPVHIITFGDKETDVLYKLFGVNAQVILEMYESMIKESFYGKISKFITGWVRNAPHKILVTCILIEALQKGYDDIVECCEYIWAFCEYPIIYRRFFKTGVKEDVMNYTIEHLGSKFTIKKVANFQAMLKYDAHSSVNSKREALLTGADNSYTDFMRRIRNQFNNRFKNIARAYFDNDEANASQHNRVSQFDDGSLTDQEGSTTNVAQVVDTTINKFTSGGINNSMVRIAADGSNVDKDNLLGFINQINTTKNNHIEKLIENIITAYFSKNPTNTSIGSGEFLNFGLALYRSISTSKNNIYQEIKQILNFWMDDVINIRQFYTNSGTIIGYTRAIFNYMILMINYYN